jgi:hypothetical protein
MASGCGKKVWPEPDVFEEKFALEIKEAKLLDSGSGDSECLHIKAFIKGNYANLAKVILELEKIGPEGDCPACPFQVHQSVLFDINAPQIMRKGRELYIRYCQVKKNTAYRVRITGRNIYTSIADAVSNIINLNP